MNLADRIRTGTKYTDADVTPDLFDTAHEYALAYEGDFAYMVDMKAKATNGGLSFSQARGVLNCMLAEARRGAQTDTTATVSVEGIVAMFAAARQHLQYPKIRLLTSTGEHIVTSIAGDRARFPGSVNILSDKDPYTGERSFYGRIHLDGRLDLRTGGTAVRDVIERFAGDPETVAKEYGKLTGNCCFCGRSLEDERSTSVGYGPICAGRYGLEWGTKSSRKENAA